MFSKKEFAIISNLRFISRTNFTLSLVEHEKSFITLRPESHKGCQSIARVTARPGLEVIKLFSCSTQLNMKFVLLINLKLLIIAKSFLLNIAEHEHFFANKYENWHFHIY